MNRNILILRSVSAEDQNYKTGYAEEIDLEAGSAVGLGDKSTERKANGAYKLAAPVADDLVGLIYNAERPFLTDVHGNEYPGLIHDPRKLYFPAKRIIDVYMPSLRDEIAMTEVAGTEDGAKYVVVKAGSTKAEYATTDADALVAFKITGKSFVSVGTDKVPTVEMICTKLA